MTSHLVELYGNISNLPITACKQYCLATGATQGNIAYTQTVISNRADEFSLDNKHSTRQR